MKVRLVITDLTRMQDQRVCVAGYTEEGRCMRPVLPPPGIQESSLYAQGKPIIFPFARVIYDLIQPTPEPPHTEDHLFNPAALQHGGALGVAERHTLLQRSLSPSVAAVFEQPIYTDSGHYVREGSGPRSLGTVRLSRPLEVLFEAEPAGVIKPRLVFADEAGARYRLAVTDLAWRYHADYLRRTEELPAAALAAYGQAALQGKEIFLRIGLARGWSKHPDRCYLQVTGIHTFPDYLDGRTFADFAPEPEEDDW